MGKARSDSEKLVKKAKEGSEKLLRKAQTDSDASVRSASKEVQEVLQRARQAANANVGPRTTPAASPSATFATATALTT